MTVSSCNNQSCDIVRHSGWEKIGDEAFFYWLCKPMGATVIYSRAIILCPPFGHEATHSYRAYRQLGDALVRAGLTVVRFDYSGTGNSVGDSAIGALGKHFIENCIHVVEQIRASLKKLGYAEVGLFGARFGGSIAALCAQQQNYDFGILWAPIVNGKRYVRELNAINLTSAQPNRNPAGSIFESAGYGYSVETINFIKAFNLKLDNLSAFTQLLYIDEAINSTLKLPRGELFACEEIANILAEPHNTRMPKQTFERILHWLTALPNATDISVSKNKPDVNSEVLIKKIDTNSHLAIYEKIIEAPLNLFCIKTFVKKPSQDYSFNKVILLVNSGSVNSSGPNRLYVSMARSLVNENCAVIRFDLSQLGDSVASYVTQENHPYADTALRDVIKMCEWIKVCYPNAELCAAGVCSGGYHVLKAAFKLKTKIIDSVVIINPLTFAWNSALSLDLPKKIDVNSETMHYKTKMLNVQAWKKVITGKVSYLYLIQFSFLYAYNQIKFRVKAFFESLGLVRATVLAKQLKILVNQGIKVSFVFADSDPGYLLLLKDGGVMVKKLIDKHKISVDIINEADHTFSTAEAKNTLITVLSGVKCENN